MIAIMIIITFLFISVTFYKLCFVSQSASKWLQSYGKIATKRLHYLRLFFHFLPKNHLDGNPDANYFFPNECKVRAMNHDRLGYIMALLHNNRYEEVVSIITITASGRRSRSLPLCCLFEPVLQMQKTS